MRSGVLRLEEGDGVEEGDDRACSMALSPGKLESTPLKAEADVSTSIPCHVTRQHDTEVCVGSSIVCVVGGEEEGNECVACSERVG